MTTVLPQIPSGDLDTHFHGKNILIIGGTAGLGRALTIELLKHGAQVTVVGRREPDQALASAKFVKKDLTLMKTAVELADEIDVTTLDALIFTVGIIAASTRQENGEGIELDLAVSYLSRLAFARRIVDKGFGSRRENQAQKPRIFVMGFPGENTTPTIDDFNSEKAYSVMPTHLNTVVGNEAMVAYLNKEFKGAVNVYGLNPGLIKTEIRDNYLGKGSLTSTIVETLIGFFNISPAGYAQHHLIHVIASPQLEDKPGAHIDQRRKLLPGNPYLAVEENQNRVMTESLKLIDKALGASSSASASEERR